MLDRDFLRVEERSDQILLKHRKFQCLLETGVRKKSNGE